MTASKPIQVCYFRNLLRVHDNQSLYHALQAKQAHVLPVICIDPRMFDISPLNKKLHQNYEPPKTWNFKMDRVAAFRNRFYFESILDLRNQLQKRKSDLLILYGQPEDVFPKLKDFLSKNKYELEKIHTHKEYAHEELNVERALSKAMDDKVVYHHDAMMVNPDDLDFVKEHTYKVYTHFRKRVEKMDNPVRAPLEIPSQLPPFPETAWDFDYAKDGHNYLKELYGDIHVKSDSRSAFPWKGGEQSALDRLDSYLVKTDGVANYKHTRNGLIGTEYSTKFSAFLAHGCISPRLIWHEMDKFEQQENKKRKRDVKAGSDDDGVYWVKFELLWRDFFRLLVDGYGKKVFMLHGFRQLDAPKDGEKKEERRNSYADKVWRKDDEQFEKWKTGQMGVPFIDACMREILSTGFMNNRGRQNVASFLTKDLEIDWRMGAEYFEHLLVDHDVYSNYGNWQYVAGVGCDPREGMRHFNILKQAFDYDPDGDYVRLWCPELENLPNEFIHCPWLMSEKDQEKYKCKIGRDYPEPMTILENWKRYYPSGASNGSITNYFSNDKKKTDNKKKVKH